jgi:hypothetical protein
MGILKKNTKRKTTKRKPATRTTRARKGERLLVTCSPLVTDYMLNDLADVLHGSFLTDPDGRYQQIVAVRVDEDARKVYGTLQEMYEAAPFMFAPLPKDGTEYSG